MCFCFDAVDRATLMSDCDGPQLAILVALVYFFLHSSPQKGKQDMEPENGFAG